ncbi:MAG: hypothetical protein U0235_20255 [Polyangiaceae bacterium]
MIRLLARALGDLKDAVLITEGQRNAAGVRPIIFVNTAHGDDGLLLRRRPGACPI